MIMMQLFLPLLVAKFVMDSLKYFFLASFKCFSTSLHHTVYVTGKGCVSQSPMNSDANTLQEENAKLKALVNLLLKAQTCDIPHSGMVFKLDGVIADSTDDSSTNDQTPSTDIADIPREEYNIEGVDFESLNKVLDSLNAQQSSTDADWKQVAVIPPPSYDEAVPAKNTAKNAHPKTGDSAPTKLSRVPSEDDYVLVSHEDVEECVHTALNEAITALNVHKYADQHDVWLALQYAKGLADARVGMDSQVRSSIALPLHHMSFNYLCIFLIHPSIILLVFADHEEGAE